MQFHPAEAVVALLKSSRAGMAMQRAEACPMAMLKRTQAEVQKWLGGLSASAVFKDGELLSSRGDGVTNFGRSMT
jgi:hypothetical protein